MRSMEGNVCALGHLMNGWSGLFFLLIVVLS
jgi:hypothetical protein